MKLIKIFSEHTGEETRFYSVPRFQKEFSSESKKKDQKLTNKEKAGAALVIPEDDLNPNNFVSSIDHILLDEKYAHEMSKASKALGVPDASDQVIKVMQEISR